MGIWFCLVQSGVPLAKKSLSDSGSVSIFRIEVSISFNKLAFSFTGLEVNG